MDEESKRLMGYSYAVEAVSTEARDKMVAFLAEHCVFSADDMMKTGFCEGPFAYDRKKPKMKIGFDCVGGEWRPVSILKWVAIKIGKRVSLKETEDGVGPFKEPVPDILVPFTWYDGCEKHAVKLGSLLADTEWAKARPHWMTDELGFIHHAAAYSRNGVMSRVLAKLYKKSDAAIIKELKLLEAKWNA
jgi:hypothetical protein